MWMAILEAVKLSFGSNISLRDFLNIVLSKPLIMIFFKEILCEYFFESSTLLYAHDIGSMYFISLFENVDVQYL